MVPGRPNFHGHAVLKPSIMRWHLTNSQSGPALMELSDDDVLEILKLFEQSKFDFLQLEHGERKITVSKGGYVASASNAAVHALPRASPASAPGTQAVAASTSAAAAAQVLSVDNGLVPVTAPMVGKFYAAAAPSDPPYVQQGDKVAVGATVGLIEVMKVFASIKTEVAGTLEKILVTNGQFVEFGQALFLIRPER
jgi:acetyl-CoA carboxylase biotin carboxyl carrier protein